MLLITSMQETQIYLTRNRAHASMVCRSPMAGGRGGGLGWSDFVANFATGSARRGWRSFLSWEGERDWGGQQGMVGGVGGHREFGRGKGLRIRKVQNRKVQN
jgi:hypothetical protein